MLGGSGLRDGVPGIRQLMEGTMLSREQMDDLMAEENDRGLRGGVWMAMSVAVSLGMILAAIALALT